MGAQPQKAPAVFPYATDKGGIQSFLYRVIRKALPIVPADSSVGAQPDTALAVFLNRQNDITNQTLICCVSGKAHTIEPVQPIGSTEP